MNCPACGKTIPEGSTFCNHCGKPVSAAEPGEAAAVSVGCARCGGTGKQRGMFGSSDCPGCRGRGSVLVMLPAQRCPLCGGSGLQEGFINKPVCGVCWGTGWADVLR